MPIYPNSSKEVTGPYFQGWEVISRALADFLLSLSQTVHVYPELQYVKESAEDKEWQEMFCEPSDGENDQIIVNCIQINRSSYPVTKTSLDNSKRFTRRSEVELHVLRSFPDFPKWHKLLDEIVTALTSMDSTLGQACLTVSPPYPGESMLTNFQGADCHSSVIKFSIEEAGILAGMDPNVKS
jgi:hypothetical protein